MSNDEHDRGPTMIAVWPGMGHVASGAGYYLMSKLGMRLISTFDDRDVFDVTGVNVHHGFIRAQRPPQSRFFAMAGEDGEDRLILFLGDAQPPIGQYAFCNRILDYSQELGVSRVFTFAAMATEMEIQDDPRVFGAATDQAGIDLLHTSGVELLEGGQIRGLNGVLLGVAAERGLRGTCLLGEIPHVLSQIHFAKSSLAVLKVFTMLAEIDLDTDELSQAARETEAKLRDILAQFAEDDEAESPEETQPYSATQQEPNAVKEEQLDQIEALFKAAQADRSRAYELKQILDQLQLFAAYEDRFLDLFKPSE